MRLSIVEFLFRAIARLRRTWPLGWDVFPLGNKILAVNRWGGARKGVHTRPLLPEGSIPTPESWCYKPRAK